MYCQNLEMKAKLCFWQLLTWRNLFHSSSNFLLVVMRLQSISITFPSKFWCSEKALAENTGFPAYCLSVYSLPSKLQYLYNLRAGRAHHKVDLGLFIHVAVPFFGKYIIFPHWCYCGFWIDRCRSDGLHTCWRLRVCLEGCVNIFDIPNIFSLSLWCFFSNVFEFISLGFFFFVSICSGRTAAWRLIVLALF